MNFFSLDGPFHKYGTIIFDLLMLNTFWLLISFFSAGLLLGPATTSLYHSLNYCVREASSKPMKEFFLNFKNNFKWSFLGGLFAIIILLADGFSLYLISIGAMPNWLFIPYFMIILYLLMVIPYFTALVVHTDFGFKKLLKYSILLCIKHLPTTFLVLIILIINGLVAWLTSFIALIIIVAPMVLIITYLISGRAFKDYDFAKFQ